MTKQLLLVSAICVMILAFVLVPVKKDQAVSFHTEAEINKFRALAQRNPLGPGEYFLPSTRCQGCHGFDSTGLANVLANGTDINLFDDWQTSMMGLSAVDPYWRAKVSHEILVNPSHSVDLQDKCTSCHAPMGHYAARFKGLHYSIYDIDGDSLGRDGVSCVGCHAIGSYGLGVILGNTFSGQIPYDTTKNADGFGNAYGPFMGPMLGPMQLYVGLNPAYSPHVSDGTFCSPCHTLITNTADLDGNYTGETFVEQATHHEWVNSVYPGEGTQCQTCHMPKIEEPIKIANGYLALPGRSPFNLHQFMGANTFMINLIKQNKNTLNVNAPDANFDSTLAATNRLLLQHTLETALTFDSYDNDTAYYSLSLKNLAGHKFPSGYPARRAVVNFKVYDEDEQLIFESGALDANYELVGNDEYLPHYDVIRAPHQAQIYEMVMGDVNGAKTTILERGAIHLKDNRIPPLGFTSAHSVYDTVKIIGNAFTDVDFNKSIDGDEGTGVDVVHYHIPINGYSGKLFAKAEVFYQSIPFHFLGELFQDTTPEIEQFKTMFNNSDRTPVRIAIDTISANVITVGTRGISPFELFITPNPSADGVVNLFGQNLRIDQISVFSADGRLIEQLDNIYQNKYRLELPASPGVYFIAIQTNKKRYTQKIVRL
jgi:hypothetical protein